MKSTLKNFLIRSYIVLLLLSTMVNIQLFPLKTLSVLSVPLSLFVFLIGTMFCMIYDRDFLIFLRERKVVLILTGLFLISGIFSAVLSPFPAVPSLKTLFHYGLFFGISFLLLFLFSIEGENIGLSFLEILIALAMILALISFFEVTNENFYRFLSDTFRGGEYQIINGHFRAGAVLAHPNIFGCFMSLGILIILYLKDAIGLKGIVFYPITAILSAAMALSGSRNAALVLLIPMLLLLSNRKTMKTAAFIIGIAIFALFVLTPTSSRFSDLWKITPKTEKGYLVAEKEVLHPVNTAVSRLWLWQGALAMFRNYPLTGIGPGNCNRAMKDYAPAQLLAAEKEKISKGYLNAHNGFLNILAEFGLTGIAIVLAFAVYCAVFFIRRYGLFPPLPVHALMAGIVLSFFPDAFFYSLFYMVIVVTLFLLFTFPGTALGGPAGSIPSDKPAP